jgi:hypothetical protein
MGIVSTTLAEDNHDQRDGSRYVQEFHTDDAGKVHRFEYRWRAGMDRAAIAAARAVQLAESVAEGEVTSALSVDVAPSIVQQTGAQFLARLREKYRGATREEAARIARWIVRRIDAGHVTAAQLRNAFNLSVAEWDALEVRMRNLAAKLDDIESAAGE